MLLKPKRFQEAFKLGPEHPLLVPVITELAVEQSRALPAEPFGLSDALAGEF